MKDGGLITDHDMTTGNDSTARPPDLTCEGLEPVNLTKEDPGDHHGDLG